MGFIDTLKYANVTSQLDKREYGGSDKFYAYFEPMHGSEIGDDILKDFNAGGSKSKPFLFCSDISIPEAKIETKNIQINDFISFDYPVFYGFPGDISVTFMDDDKYSLFRATRKWLMKMDIYGDKGSFSAVSPMKIDKISALLYIIKFNKMGERVETQTFKVWPGALPDKNLSYGGSGVNETSISFKTIDRVVLS